MASKLFHRLASGHWEQAILDGRLSRRGVASLVQQHWLQPGVPLVTNCLGMQWLKETWRRNRLSYDPLILTALSRFDEYHTKTVGKPGEPATPESVWRTLCDENRFWTGSDAAGAAAGVRNVFLPQWDASRIHQRVWNTVIANPLDNPNFDGAVQAMTPVWNESGQYDRSAWGEESIAGLWAAFTLSSLVERAILCPIQWLLASVLSLGGMGASAVATYGGPCRSWVMLPPVYLPVQVGVQRQPAFDANWRAEKIVAFLQHMLTSSWCLQTYPLRMLSRIPTEPSLTILPMEPMVGAGRPQTPEETGWALPRFFPFKEARQWRSSDVVGLAAAIVMEQQLDRLPILGDALMDAGCEKPWLLKHCRAARPRENRYSVLADWLYEPAGFPRNSPAKLASA